MTNLLYKASGKIFLLLCVLVTLGPFLDQRVLRMAGDEKVYITQTVEMARGGRWFVQTLADEPSYFKGPLHYILVRIGLLVSGDRIIAGTWMNGLFALLAAFALYHLGRKRWGDKSGLLLGVAAALNVGVVSHALVSQMEVEVYAFYAFATAALGLADRKHSDFRRDIFFWLAAGLAGWSKSPLHSALIGSSGVLYWALTRQLGERLQSAGSWLALFSGIGLGALGYLPAVIADYKNFSETFLGREQFQKGGNGRTWDYVMKPLVHFLLPWTFVVLAAIVKMARAGKKKRGSDVDLPMVKLGLAISLPTMLFWCTWAYKGQNYNLPTIPGLLVFGWAAFNGSPPRWTSRAAGILGLVVLLLAIGVFAHFWPLPSWWGLGWTLLALLGMAAFAFIFIGSDDFRALAAGTVAFFIAFSAFITPLGQREMIDLREFLKEHPEATYHYYNLDPSIWSEWALLQLTVHHPVHGLHKPAQLAEATRPGHVILAQNTDWLNKVMDYWRKNRGDNPQPIITPWTRWLTKGKSQDGQSRWKLAWESRDIKQLEREFFIIHFPVR